MFNRKLKRLKRYLTEGSTIILNGNSLQIEFIDGDLLTCLNKTNGTKNYISFEEIINHIRLTKSAVTISDECDKILKRF